MSDTLPVPPPVPPVATPAANPYVMPGAAPASSVPSAPGRPSAYGPPTNSLAIVALVLSFVVSVAGIICGHIALSQIKRTGEGGRGLALAGVIVGYVITGFWVLYFVGVIAFVAIGAASGGFNSSNH